MSEEEWLLGAVAGEPDVILHRLAYADWLDENGRQQHAAFVRGQCLLYPLLVPRGVEFEDGPDPRVVDLYQVEEELARQLLGPLLPFLEESQADWRGPRTFNRQFNAGLRRGFVEKVDFWGPHCLQLFLAHAPEVFSRVPIRSLEYWHGPARPQPSPPPPPLASLLTGLLGSAGVQRLEELSVLSGGLHDGCAETFLNAGAVSWRKLTLNCTLLSPDMRESLQSHFGRVFNPYVEEEIPF